MSKNDVESVTTGFVSSFPDLDGPLHFFAITRQFTLFEMRETARENDEDNLYISTAIFGDKSEDRHFQIHHESHFSEITVMPGAEIYNSRVFFTQKEAEKELKKILKKEISKKKEELKPLLLKLKTLEFQAVDLSP